MYLTADFLRRGLPAGRQARPVLHARAATRSGWPSPGSTGWRRARCIDRLGLRRQTEQAVFTVTRSGFRTATAAGRQFARVGTRGAPGHPAGGRRGRSGLFDLTPTEDEQMLVDVVAEFAAEVRAARRRRGRRGLRRPRVAAAGQPGDRAADPRGARGARRHLRGALRHGRHPRRRGARQGRHGPGRRRPRPRRRRHRPRAVGHRRPAADLPARLHRRRRPGRRAGAHRADGALRPARRRPPRPGATATATSSTASSPRSSVAPRPSSSSSAPSSRARRSSSSSSRPPRA